MEKTALENSLAAAATSGASQELMDLSKQAVEQHPEDAFGYAYLSQSFMMQVPPAYPQAELCIAKAIELDEQNTEYRRRFAEMKEAQGMYEHAQIIALQLLDIDPKNAFALRFLGMYWLRIQQNPDLANQYFEQLLALDPQNPEYLAYRVETLFLGEHYEQALAAANAILAQGFHEQTQVLKIQILQELKRPDELDALFRQLIEKCPTTAAYAYQYGMFLFALEHYADAEKQLAKAYSLLPEGQFDLSLYSNLGQASLQVGNYAQALQVLAPCVQAQPEETAWQTLLAEAKVGTGDYAGALADADRLIANAAGDDYLENTGQMLKGMALTGLGKYDDAEAIFNALLKIPLFETDAHYGLGMLRHRQGKLSKSYAHLKQARHRGSSKAFAYIQEHLSGYLADTKKAVLEKLAPFAGAADQSPLIQKLTGALWVFEAVKSKQMEAYPPELVKNISELLRDYALVFTERGFLLVQNNKHEAAAYRIDKAGGDALQLELHPIDGLAPYMIRLRLDNAGLLYSKEEGEFIRFKRQDPASVEPRVQANFRKQVAAAEMDFLGEKAKGIVQAMFG